MQNSLIPLFRKVYDSSPEVLSHAPGRINIIGEHTDYNLGYVLPAALNMRNTCLLSRRPDHKVRLWTENFKQKDEFSLGQIIFSEENKWVNYIRGIFWVLEEEGCDLQGIDGLIWGDIPLESGLSTSAALEVSIVHGLNTLFKLDLPPLKMVELARKAENEFVGVQCGIMDQFISVFGQENKAVFLDCETLDTKLVPFRLKEEGLQVVVYETGVRRELAGSEYNRRRSESSQALEILRKIGVEKYKDATLDALEKMKNEMDDTVFRRARHVINENERVKKAVRAMEKDDFNLLGDLLFRSHESLRDDYEVSCPELDLLYESGRKFPACYGARLTGAGFGGSGIALVKNQEVTAFKQELLENAKNKGFVQPRFYEVDVGRGADSRFLEMEELR
jgi:galactokinase